MQINHTKPLTLTVTQLNQEIKSLLEKSFASIYVAGEISNFSQPSSGHWYFSLKDDAAQVRCAMFRGNNLQVKALINNGTHVIARARVSLYAPRGDYQLIIESLEPAGLGKLQQAFNALKVTLEQRGWFSMAHKKSLPHPIQTIGIITSPTGAAIRDIIRVARRRYPLVTMILYPCLVQGTQAAAQIAARIDTANRRREVDVLLLARGGGSLEDLWAFNEEIVAKAIYESRLPIVTGIGHQTDFTIADFVADLRAPTPSSAAEMLTPDQAVLRLQFNKLFRHLYTNASKKLEHTAQTADWLFARLARAHPKMLIRQQSKHLGQLHKLLVMQGRQHYQHTARRYQALCAAFATYHPAAILRTQGERLHSLQHRLASAGKRLKRPHEKRFALLAASLEALSPLAVLARGYSLAQTEDGQVIRDSAEVSCQARIHLTLSVGALICRVLEIK